MRKIIYIITILLLFQLPTFYTFAQNSPLPAALPYAKGEFRSPFRYIVVGPVTTLEKKVNSFPEDHLLLEVLLDEKAFSEENLKILSVLLSKRFNISSALSIDIYTSLEAIKTPEENDHGNLKGPLAESTAFKHATFVRNSFGNEWFEYSVPGEIDKKIVVIKGCYIKCDIP